MNYTLFKVTTSICVATILFATGSLWAQTPGNISAASGNIYFSSSTAIAPTFQPNPIFSAAAAFDGILNSTESNGAVFDLNAVPNTTFNANLVDVANVTRLNLFQRVGSLFDNGIRDFTATFFGGENQTGQVLLTTPLSAVLNTGDDAQTFLLGTTVVNPESFSLEVTSAYGDPSRAEFSEVTFDGALATVAAVAVPEPSSVIVGFFAVSLVSCRRRRKLDA